MSYRYDTAHLTRQQQELIRQKDEQDRKLKAEAEKRRKEENNYYIRLIVSADEEYEWSFKSLKSRNTAYEKVFMKFESEKSYQVPFIEIEVGDDEINFPTMQNSLRLKVEMKSEVINYIESLV